jgi:hypothetical protein
VPSLEALEVITMDLARRFKSHAIPIHPLLSRVRPADSTDGFTLPRRVASHSFGLAGGGFLFERSLRDIRDDGVTGSDLVASAVLALVEALIRHFEEILRGGDR